MSHKIFREIHLHKHQCTDDKCIRPFCYCKGNTPKELRLCGGCFNDLAKIVGGANNIYNYKTTPPTLKITIKEALELLLVNNKGCQQHFLLNVNVKVITTEKSIELPKSQNTKCLTVENGDDYVQSS